MRLTAIARERQHLPILLASDITRRLRLQTQCENIARARKPFANSDRQELAIRTRPRPSMNIKISAPDTHTHTHTLREGWSCYCAHCIPLFTTAARGSSRPPYRIRTPASVSRPGPHRRKVSPIHPSIPSWGKRA
ncbi:hypothetical protein CGCF415_v000611 [Colletotrichum fructicola]|nr:hypothetical protein CGCF415_v000611 [Colletotrichum fructicola]